MFQAASSSKYLAAIGESENTPFDPDGADSVDWHWIGCECPDASSVLSIVVKTRVFGWPALGAAVRDTGGGVDAGKPAVCFGTPAGAGGGHPARFLPEHGNGGGGGTRDERVFQQEVSGSDGNKGWDTISFFFAPGELHGTNINDCLMTAVGVEFSSEVCVCSASLSSRNAASTAICPSADETHKFLSMSSNNFVASTCTRPSEQHNRDMNASLFRT